MYNPQPSASESSHFPNHMFAHGITSVDIGALRMCQNPSNPLRFDPSFSQYVHGVLRKGKLLGP